MRILYFTRDYTPHDHRFLSALAKTEHTVYSLRLERRGLQLEDRPLPDRVEQVIWRGGQKPVSWRDDAGLIWDLKRVIRRVKPDVIHAGPIQSSAFLAALSGFHPLVSMSWGSDLLRDADKNSTMRWATRFTLHRSTILVGDCDAVRQKAINFGFPDKRIVIFPWGVDLEHFSPGPVERMENTGNIGTDFKILSLRSWEPIYGVDLVARAFIQACQQVPDLHLMLLGAGTMAAQIHTLLEQAQRVGQVTFGGQVSYKDLPHFYQSADLYLSASHSDGSSVSLMEALACGCPVLVSDIPGNREWITPGIDGWLFPDGDPTALTQGILKALAIKNGESGQFQEMSKAARYKAESRANWTRNFQDLLRAYELALTLKNHPD